MIRGKNSGIFLEILIRIITTSILSSSYDFCDENVQLEDMALHCTLTARFDFYFYLFSFHLFFLSRRCWQRWRVILFVDADFWFNFSFFSNLPRCWQLFHVLIQFVCVCVCVVYYEYINLHSDSTRYAHFIPFRRFCQHKIFCSHINDEYVIYVCMLYSRRCQDDSSYVTRICLLVVSIKCFSPYLLNSNLRQFVISSFCI